MNRARFWDLPNNQRRTRRRGAAHFGRGTSSSFKGAARTIASGDHRRLGKALMTYTVVWIPQSESDPTALWLDGSKTIQQKNLSPIAVNADALTCVNRRQGVRDAGDGGKAEFAG